MKHTPGPWKWTKKFEDDMGGRPCQDGELKAGDKTVLFAGDCQWEGTLVFKNIADARLIEAAPDMYAALKAIDTECRDTNPNGDITVPSHVWDLITRALAKAERKGRK